MISRTRWLIFDAAMLVLSILSLTVDFVDPKFYGWIPIDLAFIVFWVFFFLRDWKKT